jgi:hypothetical protein
MATFDNVGHSTFDSIPGSLSFDNWGVDQTLPQGTRATFASTFYAPTVNTVYRLTVGLAGNAQTFYGPTVLRGTVTLTAARFNNAQTFYAATVGRGPVGLTASLFTNGQTFYAPAVTATRALTAGLFSNAQTFYAATVLRGPVNLSPALVSDGDTVYAPSALYREPQYARPVADLSQGAWTASSGSDLFAMVDEQPANDADFITATNPAVCLLRLAPVVDPQTSNGQSIRIRAKSARATTLIATLKQGTTTIATGTISGVASGWTDYEVQLSSAQCDAITDYTDLRVELEAA